MDGASASPRTAPDAPENETTYHYDGAVVNTADDIADNRSQISEGDGIVDTYGFYAEARRNLMAKNAPQIVQDRGQSEDSDVQSGSVGAGFAFSNTEIAKTFGAMAPPPAVGVNDRFDRNRGRLAPGPLRLPANSPFSAYQRGVSGSSDRRQAAYHGGLHSRPYGGISNRGPSIARSPQLQLENWAQDVSNNIVEDDVDVKEEPEIITPRRSKRQQKKTTNVSPSIARLHQANYGVGWAEDAEESENFRDAEKIPEVNSHRRSSSQNATHDGQQSQPTPGAGWAAAAEDFEDAVDLGDAEEALESNSNRRLRRQHRNAANTGPPPQPTSGAGWAGDAVVEDSEDVEDIEYVPQGAGRRRPGRPRGSKNIPKDAGAEIENDLFVLQKSGAVKRKTLPVVEGLEDFTHDSYVQGANPYAEAARDFRNHHDTDPRYNANGYSETTGQAKSTHSAQTPRKIRRVDPPIAPSGISFEIPTGLLPSRYSGAPITLGTNKPPQMTRADEVSEASLLKRNLKPGQGAQVCKRGYGANDPENIRIVNLREVQGMPFEAIVDLLNKTRLDEGRKPNLTFCGVFGRYNRTAPILFASQGRIFVPLAKRKKGKGLQLHGKPIPVDRPALPHGSGPLALSRSVAQGDADGDYGDDASADANENENENEIENDDGEDDDNDSRREVARNCVVNGADWSKDHDRLLVEIHQEYESNRWHAISEIFFERSGLPVTHSQVAIRYTIL